MSAPQRKPVTLQGRRSLEKQLHLLKTVERKRIVQAISEARELGDLSENAEYHAAREQNSFNETKIAEIESALANADVIDVRRLSGNKILFGATVTVLNLNDNQESSYQIVGEPEADVDQRRISFSSPLARSLIGKSVGDVVNVKTPKHTSSYEIINIQFIADLTKTLPNPLNSHFIIP